jgi:uncharacterized glyoxalase superfamily protein PhnB
MFRIVPQLTVKDVSASASFYAERLGFRVSLLDPEEKPIFAALDRDEASLFLVSMGSREEGAQVRDLMRNKCGVGVRLYFEVDDARAVYDSLNGAGISIERDLTYNEKEDYTEFSILDPDGYEIGVYS